MRKLKWCDTQMIESKMHETVLYISKVFFLIVRFGLCEGSGRSSFFKLKVGIMPAVRLSCCPFVDTKGVDVLGDWPLLKPEITTLSPLLGVGALVDCPALDTAAGKRLIWPAFADAGPGFWSRLTYWPFGDFNSTSTFFFARGSELTADADPEGPVVELAALRFP